MDMDALWQIFRNRIDDVERGGCNIGSKPTAQHAAPHITTAVKANFRGKSGHNEDLATIYAVVMPYPCANGNRRNKDKPSGGGAGGALACRTASARARLRMAAGTPGS